MSSTPLQRKDIRTLTDNERDKLIFAFYKIQKLDPGGPGALNKDSFYVIAGYHGQPFRGGGYQNENWWGGYCHHGNVLFPTWHRAYVRHLEQALNNQSGYSDIAMPYWNEIDLDHPEVPSIFTDPTYTFQSDFEKINELNPGDLSENDRGETILARNPIHSYKLQKGFFDNLKRVFTSKDQKESKSVDYSKNTEYETVRCPYSGLVGPDDIDDTTAHNDSIHLEDATPALNYNVRAWMTQPDKKGVPGIQEQCVLSLLAPNYTVFSNTTSAAKWNDDNYGRKDKWDSEFVTSLEKPHNGTHLAVGGYSMPDRSTDRPNKYPGANGDMGENDTAAFDPIFFFHHCFVDAVFWKWQQDHQATDKLDIFENYPGTSSIDSQGPTAFMPADSQLTVETDLVPFKKENGKYLKTTDLVDITKFGYDYDLPDFPASQIEVETVDGSALPIVRMSGISRAQRPGSFVVSIVVHTDDGEQTVGIEPVFSRWHVPSCANCNNSLNVIGHYILPRELTVVHNGRPTRLGNVPAADRHDVATALVSSMRMEILENAPAVGLLENKSVGEVIPGTQKKISTHRSDQHFEVMEKMWTTG